MLVQMIEFIYWHPIYRN